LGLAVAPLVLSFFSLTVAGGKRRNGRFVTGLIALTASVAYYSLLYETRAWFNAGRLDPMLAAWIPDVAFLLAALLLRWRHVASEMSAAQA